MRATGLCGSNSSHGHGCNGRDRPRPKRPPTDTPRGSCGQRHDPSTETTMTVGEMTLEDAAREAAGNWKRFESFCWFRERDLDDPENWAIIYTHNRDSRLLDQSNAD